MLIQNYEKITSFISNIQASYAWLYKSLDVMVKTHRIPLINSLIEAKQKNEVQLEIERYMEKLRWEGTGDELELSAHNMQKYIGGHVMVKMMVHMLQDELDKRLQDYIPKSYGGKSSLSKDKIKMFGDIIT